MNGGESTASNLSNGVAERQPRNRGPASSAALPPDFDRRTAGGFDQAARHNLGLLRRVRHVANVSSDDRAVLDQRELFGQGVGVFSAGLERKYL